MFVLSIWVVWNCRRVIKELVALENDFIKLSENINLRKVRNHFHYSYKTSNTTRISDDKITDMYKLIKDINQKLL